MKVGFYHIADNDGRCSGAIIRRADPTTKMVGANYGWKVPWDLIDGNDIIIADFSYSIEDMVEIQRRANSLVWLDHHYTAMKEAREYGFDPKGFRNERYAACELTWNFYNLDTMPDIVYNLGRYDIWKHNEAPNGIAINRAVDSYDCDPSNPKNLVLWEQWFSGPLDSLIEEGNIIVRSQRSIYERECKAIAFETELDGLKIIAANYPHAGSLFFDSVWNPKKYDAMCLFYITRRGDWRVSLYTDNKPGVNVGDIAKRYGGGGHKGAAGFCVKELPFEFERN